MEKQCTAIARQTRVRCKLKATNGTTKCRLHGGNSLRGVASPSFKHGKYSRYSVPKLFTRWKELLEDPNPHSLLDEITLIRARIEDVLVSLEANTLRADWEGANITYRKYEVALRSKDAIGMGQALQELGGVLRAGMQQEDRWSVLESSLEQLRRMVETDRKAQDLSEKYLTVDQGMMIVSMAIAAVKDEVKDPQVLVRIMNRLNRDVKLTG